MGQGQTKREREVICYCAGVSGSTGSPQMANEYKDLIEAWNHV
jgi:hypothetical protein